MAAHPEEQLSAYLDDALTPDERREVEAHIGNCESCQALLEDLLAMQQELMQTYRLIQAPADLEVRVLQSIGLEDAQAKVGKGWFVALLLGLMTLTVLYFLTGAVILKLVHGFSKLMITLMYATSHFILSVPVLSGGTVVLSFIILAASFFSLRRLLQTTAS